MEEIWKDIQGFEGHYQLSNMGRVRMLDVWVNRHYIKGEKLVLQLRGHLIKPRSKDGGTVRLRWKTIEVHFRIDKLVAIHFRNDYRDGMMISHIDGCVSNNSSDNLKFYWPEKYNNEIWKDVKGFEGKYQVSDLGRVRSLDRTSFDKAGRMYHTKGMILKNSLNKTNGYTRVSLSDGHRNYTHYEVHRLVALHFVPGYKPGLVVNHKDENKLNNRADNLEWCTYQYNLNYSDVVAWKRKPVYQYDLDGNFIAKHKCCAEVEKMMGVYQGAMVHVMYESKVGMWHGFRWSYEFRTKEQWAEILKHNKSSRRPVVQLNDNDEEVARFDTITEAAKFMNVSVSAISKCTKGNTKHAAGYKWHQLY